MGSMWMVGRDSNLSFWLGNWTKRGPTRKLIQGPLTQEADHCEIKDAWWTQVGIGTKYPLIFLKTLS